MQRQARRINAQSHRPLRSNPTLEKAQELRKRPKNTLMVEHALVINLPRSPERLKAFQAANNFEHPTEVIWAIDGFNLPTPRYAHMGKGDTACLLSHKLALERAKNESWPCVMIFEDDVSFPNDFNERLKLSMGELPDNWDMLWLAGSQRYPSVLFTQNLLLMEGAWGAYGYILKNTVYDYFINCFATGEQSCDTFYSTYHSKFNSFRTTPDLIKHIGNVSERMIVNHEK